MKPLTLKINSTFSMSVRSVFKQAKHKSSLDLFVCVSYFTLLLFYFQLESFENFIDARNKYESIFLIT